MQQPKGNGGGSARSTTRSPSLIIRGSLGRESKDTSQQSVQVDHAEVRERERERERERVRECESVRE
jgi:hypothetical protein